MRRFITGALVVASLELCGAGQAVAEQAAPPPEPNTNDEFNVDIDEPPPTGDETTDDNVRPDGPKMNSRGMVIGGGVLTGLGLAAAVTSVPFFSEAAGCRGDFCGFYTAFGVGFAATGALFLGIGIPLVVVGAKPARSSLAGVAPDEVQIGPGSAALRWRF